MLFTLKRPTDDSGKPVAFAAAPEEYRTAVRAIIEDMGGHVSGYSNDGLCIALPRDDKDRAAITHILDRLGWPCRDKALCSLGTDNPPDYLRHHGPYNPPTDAPAYWMFGQFA